MFSSVYPASRVKQPVTFLVSLSLQCAILAVLCRMPFPQTYRPCLRRDDVHAALVTPLYFLQHTTPAPPPSKLAPELPGSAKRLEAKLSEPEADAKPDASPAVTPDATLSAEATGDASGNGEGQGLAPFPGWQMNSASAGHGFMHHQVKSALPVFTPEPPILHSEIPEPARGKDVVMNVVINEQGSIVAVQVLQGIGYGVENSIVETLRRWIYVPAKINGMAIASQQELHFHFPG